jgi:PIN domain nuclease of toxin-antitoxin system
MRVLLDTHVLIWWLLGEAALSPTARAVIADDANETFVSAASAWEISIKYKQGKLPTATRFVADLEDVITGRGFTALPITIKNGERAGSLPSHHKDPFDRMLIAQALAESLTLISNERLFDNYGVARLW